MCENLDGVLKFIITPLTNFSCLLIPDSSILATIIVILYVGPHSRHIRRAAPTALLVPLPLFVIVNSLPSHIF